MNNEIFIEENRPHESGGKHVSGYAHYIDDIVEPEGTLYGAIGWSKKAHAIIRKLDLKEVWKSEGVVSVITYKDIPGRNDVGAVYEGDPIFPPKKVEYFGQPLFAVAATSTELARKAVLRAKISYKYLEPTIEIKDALNNGNDISSIINDSVDEIIDANTQSNQVLSIEAVDTIDEVDSENENSIIAFTERELNRAKSYQDRNWKLDSTINTAAWEYVLNNPNFNQDNNIDSNLNTEL